MICFQKSVWAYGNCADIICLFCVCFQQRQNPGLRQKPVRLLKLKRQRSLFWRVFKELRRERCAQMCISTALKLWAFGELPSIRGVLLPGPTNLIIMPSSSIHWRQSQQWRRSKTIIHLCLSLTWELTSLRSRPLWRSCMTLMPPRSTLLSGTLNYH